MGNRVHSEAEPKTVMAPTVPLPGRLRRQAALEAAVHLTILLLVLLVFSRQWLDRGVLAGGVAILLVLVIVHGLLWRNLPANRRAGYPGVVPELGTANRITLFRGLLISLTAGGLFFTPDDDPTSTVLAWLPGGLYLTAAVLDGLDGAWARRTRTQSPLGKTLDTRYDALGVLVASGVAVGTHRLPIYYVGAGAIYYLFHLGLWLRRRHGKPTLRSGSRIFARLVAGFQMGFLGVALLPVFSDRVLAIAAPVFLTPLLAGFAWDWAGAVGRIDDTVKRRWRARLAILSAKGPLLLRVVVLLSGGLLLAMPVPGLFPGNMAIVAGLVVMIVVGFLGRVAALMLSLVLAGQASVADGNPALFTALVASLLIMLMGTGDASLWQPEDKLLLREPDSAEDG